MAVLHCVLGHFVTDGHRFGPFLDAWLHEHGPAFAAAAVIERCSMWTHFSAWSGDKQISTDERAGLAWIADADHGDLRRIRTAVAAAEDYRAVIEALAARRTTPLRKLIAAFLCPERDRMGGRSADHGVHRAPQA